MHAACRTLLTLDGLRIPVWRSHPLKRRNPRIVRLVVVIHGTMRNADAYFSFAIAAAHKAKALASSLIVAPRFEIAADNGRKKNRLYWRRNAHWKIGNLSARDREPRMSSFTVLDRILLRIVGSGRFPHLRRIVVTGHSAGGQFVQRYAVGSQTPSRLERDGLRIRFVPANPGSYVYLSPHRPVQGAPNRFAVPNQPSCADYDHYKYGLKRRNQYMGRLTAEDLRTQYARRDVVYFVGARDRRAMQFDRSCRGMLQGKSRIARGEAYARYIDFLLPDHRHRFVRQPGIGHSAAKMFASETGRTLLFGD